MPEDKLMSLVAASCDLVSRLDLEEVLARVLARGKQAVEAESCSVLLHDPTTDELCFYSATRMAEQKLQQVRFDAGTGIAGQVFRSGEGVRIADAASDPQHFGGVDETSGVTTRSLLCVPLRVEDKTIGVLEAINSRREEGFTESDLRLLDALASFAGVAIQNAEEFQRVRLQAEAFRRAAEQHEICVGQSPAMQQVWDTCARVAPTDSTVLLTGESGVGKEVVARHISQSSLRKDGPFICVNCAGLDENLLNSELFGHEKGAFTGATARRIGRFELAHTGTLFFDEVTECSPATQARLLRVLQEQSFERVGGTDAIRTDARLLAATNADIEQRVREGRFREDLYYRLNVVRIRIPPLRERREEIPELMAHCLARSAGEMNRPIVQIAPDAMAALTDYPWPGNVRELKNLAERIMVLHPRPTVTAADVARYLPGAPGAAGAASTANALSTPGAAPDESTPAAPDPPASAAPAAPAPAASTTEQPPTQPPAATPQPPMSLHEHEKFLIEEALRTNAWNQSSAARELGVTRHYLRYRIKKYGIQTRPG